MKLILALAVACLAAVPSFADTKLIELPAGSTIRLKGRHSIPAGWTNVVWGDGAIGFRFHEKLRNNLDLSGEVKTKSVGVFAEIPCKAISDESDESSGKMRICIPRYEYKISLDSQNVNTFVFDDIHEFGCRNDADGNVIREKVGRGQVTVELINACFARLLEIIPNTAVIRP